jgi:hypothetical protein
MVQNYILGWINGFNYCITEENSPQFDKLYRTKIRNINYFAYLCLIIYTKQLKLKYYAGKTTNHIAP